LLENEINFTRDENGFYVALVKLLNPAFYGKGVENNTQVSQFEKAGSIEAEAKPRSSSQVNKKTTAAPNKQESIKNPTSLKEKANFEKNNQNPKVFLFILTYRIHQRIMIRCSAINLVFSSKL
jgi:hypothetical protein